MSKLKLVLPGGRSLTLSSNLTKYTNRMGLMVTIINLVSLFIFSLFAFLVPVSGIFFSLDQETSVLRFLIIFVMLFLLIFLLKLIIQGSSFVIDPKGLLMILVFNLILTLSSLSINVIKVSGTFGTMGFRYLSGLTLMALIGLFYFVNLYSSNTLHIRRTLKLFVLGTFVYILLSLSGTLQNSAEILNSVPLLVSGFALLSVLITTTKQKVVGTFILLIYLLLALIVIPFNTSVYPQLFFYSLSLLAAYLLSLTLYWTKTRKDFSKKVEEIRNNVRRFFAIKRVPTPTLKGLTDLHFVLVYIAPVILILLSAFFLLSTPLSSRNSMFNNISFTYNESIKLVTGGTYTITGENLRSVLLGVGSDNYSSAWPFFANVIVVSGLIGAAIYLFLWIYFIKIAKENFLRTIKEKRDFKLNGVLLFLSLFLPLVFLTNYGGILNLIILWLVYGILSSMQTLRQSNYLSNNIDRKMGRLPTKIIKSVLIIVSFIAVWNILNIALNLVK